ncbi:hypothetical protein MBAV_001745, partial [Candidatus Magnetobacterium bavaricum]
MLPDHVRLPEDTVILPLPVPDFVTVRLYIIGISGGGGTDVVNVADTVQSAVTAFVVYVVPAKEP